MKPKYTSCTMICQNPNCGYNGRMRIIRKGDVWLGIILFFFAFMILGILYFIFCMGNDTICPKCGMKQNV